MRSACGLIPSALLAIVAASCTGFDAPAIDPSDQSSAGDAGPTDAGATAFSFDMGTSPLRVGQGASTKIPISIARRGSSPADVQITLKNAPSGVTAGSLTIPSTESSGELTIAIENSVSQGPISVTIEGHAVNDGVLVSVDMQLFVAGLPGTLDTTFAQGGRFADMLGRMLSPITALVSGDDRIYVLGSCYSSISLSPWSTCVARLTPNGELDVLSYGNSGVAALDTLSPNDAVLLSDGSMVVGGYANDTDPNDGIAHDKAAYVIIDATGRAGKRTILSTAAAFVGTTTNSVSQTSLAPDDSVVLFFTATDGGGNNMNGIAKITSAGDLDPKFGNGGFVNVNFADYHSGEADAVPLPMMGAGVYTNGNIVIMGAGANAGGTNLTSSLDTYFGFLQFDNSGVRDTSFGTNGQTAFKGPTVPDWGVRQGNPLTLRLESRILWVTNDSMLPAIWAFTADGTSLDSTFGANGFLDPNSIGEPTQVHVVLDDQNRFLVTSTTASTTASGHEGTLSRYTGDGVLDPSFGEFGQATTKADSPVSAHVQSDGRIVVVTQEGTVLRYWN
ncbi:MAG: hypothetical protein FWD73_14605 [Polyangiaceae bacterium]|nr:hypothetical protein [Polyangiaceae bacterium]